MSAVSVPVEPGAVQRATGRDHHDARPLQPAHAAECPTLVAWAAEDAGGEAAAFGMLSGAVPASEAAAQGAAVTYLALKFAITNFVGSRSRASLRAAPLKAAAAHAFPRMRRSPRRRCPGCATSPGLRPSLSLC